MPGGLTRSHVREAAARYEALAFPDVHGALLALALTHLRHLRVGRASGALVVAADRLLSVIDALVPKQL